MRHSRAAMQQQDFDAWIIPKTLGPYFKLANRRLDAHHFNTGNLHTRIYRRKVFADSGVTAAFLLTRYKADKKNDRKENKLFHDEGD